MEPALSVIICTHNPRLEYLQRVLGALEMQTLPAEQWQLLIVDSASQEPVAKRFDLSWHPHARHVREEELGLTPARLRGIREAESELLLFLDDDNLASPTYLETGCRIAHAHPNLGCFGAGVLKPEFEEEPRPEHLPYLRFLALRTLDRTVWGNSPAEMPLPWGAGLVVKRSVADYYLKVVGTCPIRSSLDRKGQVLVSGGDDEFSWVASELGLGMGIFVELKITHLIDKRRVREDYLKRIVFGNGHSCAVLSHLHGLGVKNPFAVPQLRESVLSLVKGHPAQSATKLLNWLAFKRRSETERAFQAARSQGWEAGLKSLSLSK